MIITIFVKCSHEYYILMPFPFAKISLQTLSAGQMLPVQFSEPTQMMMMIIHTMQNIYNYVVICARTHTHTYVLQFVGVYNGCEVKRARATCLYTVHIQKTTVFYYTRLSPMKTKWWAVSFYHTPYVICKFELNTANAAKNKQQKSIYGQWFCHIEHSVLFSTKEQCAYDGLVCVNFQSKALF